jgi:hypothetical protein
MTALECAQLKELWQERIADFHTSGLSSREWCAQQGVKMDRLHYWNRKLQPPDADASETVWVALETSINPQDRPDDALVVHVGPAAVTVRPGFDPGFLQSLVRALATC